MAVALPSALQPAIINERINRLNLINDRLQRFFGMERGGRAVQDYGGRRGSWDVFSSSRNVPDGRMPGAPAGTIAANPVGRVTFTFPRSANKLPLPLEELHNLRPIGGPVANLDIAGQNYIAEQERILAQEITNLREFQIAAMLRGSYTYTQVGDALQHGFSGGGITVNYQIPSTNTGNLNGIISTLWSNPSAPIINNCLAVNALMQQLCGRGLKHVFVSSVGWGYVVNNVQVQDQSGSAEKVFDHMRSDNDNGFIATLRGAPWIVWHIIDDGLSLQGTFTKLIPDNRAVFLPDPTPDVFSFYQGSEPVIEWVGRPAVERFGEYYWAKPTDDPAGYQLMNVFNGIPALKVPAAVFFGSIA
ncbi:MAG TPA: major capsid protein [Pirellulales bacterium]|nr:major capsid protein [Pirellulales bacterium]